MKIWLYTLCWNEMAILPFVVEYWEKLMLDKVIVYDNGSTDGSLEFLASIPYVEIRHFDSDGMNDVIQRDIKNSCWKEAVGKADFVIVCDMDELLYSDDFEGELQKMKDGGFNVLGCKWYTLCEDFMPEHKDGVLLHTQCHKFYSQRIQKVRPDLGKFTLFDPNLVEDMRYGVGCHYSCVRPQLNLYETNGISGIHIDKGFGVDYMIRRRGFMNNRLSETNRKNNYCFEYGYSAEKIREEYANNQKVSFDINV